ncbi:hypothetical protein Z517_09412 [Fonsecaea pedrosoi CBS 271.37]|uniref:C2H2-type domain-containing protein n=1 Tax=Fonsecaea pedrosoi CBS 271.37 TaxID=1442368 RepID=A0A0D2G8G9_9EURO|nr:uncharacterized protein Z517_09412 [Fonsecaea pedrosoi CBS 271.37]KIW76968.1 hypothetical protein Z517_09412 [Fonsecaea pedrosoi CBS 271.37]
MEHDDFGWHSFAEVETQETLVSQPVDFDFTEWLNEYAVPASSQPIRGHDITLSQTLDFSGEPDLVSTGCDFVSTSREPCTVLPSAVCAAFPPQQDWESGPELSAYGSGLSSPWDESGASSVGPEGLDAWWTGGQHDELVATISPLRLHRPLPVACSPSPTPAAESVMPTAPESGIAESVAKSTAAQRFPCPEPGCGCTYARKEYLKRHTQS